MRRFGNAGGATFQARGWNTSGYAQAEALIELAAIRGNAASLAAMTSADVLAVVKANGYGHGAVRSAQAALEGGASWLGVCTSAEALELRAAGIKAPILAWLLGPGQPLGALIKSNIDISIATIGLLEETLAAVQTTGKTARVHIKVDTGMSRGGAPASAWPELLAAVAKARAEHAVEVVGVWSHLACADEPGHASIEAQLSNFDAAVKTAEQYGVRPQIRHLANSAATLTEPRAHYDLVRTGISLYGYSPIPERAPEFGLRPAMTLRGQVLLTKRVLAGEGVSYGHTYRTSRETTLALVGLGYADGVSRAASNRGPLWLANARRTIAGRVSMDQIVVDVGDDPVRAGDYAVLFGPGDAGEPTADDWARTLDTISYEILTSIGNRVERVYR